MFLLFCNYFLIASTKRYQLHFRQQDELKPSTQVGVNAKRSYILISSIFSKNGVKLFSGTPINLEDDSPGTPAGVTSEGTRGSEPDASVAFGMPLHSTVQQDFSSSLITFPPLYLSFL